MVSGFQSMKRPAFVLLALLWLPISSYSQAIEVIPPAPNAAKLGEFQAQRPNLYTGTASVNIPLYTIDFDGWQLTVSSITVDDPMFDVSPSSAAIPPGGAVNISVTLTGQINSWDTQAELTINSDKTGGAFNKVILRTSCN